MAPLLSSLGPNLDSSKKKTDCHLWSACFGLYWKEPFFEKWNLKPDDAGFYSNCPLSTFAWFFAWLHKTIPHHLGYRTYHHWPSSVEESHWTGSTLQSLKEVLFRHNALFFLIDKTLKFLVEQLFGKKIFDSNGWVPLDLNQVGEARIELIWNLKWKYCCLKFFEAVIWFSLQYRSFCLDFRLIGDSVPFSWDTPVFKSFSWCFWMNFISVAFWLHSWVWRQFSLSFHIHLRDKLFQTQSSFSLPHSYIFRTCSYPYLNLQNRCPFLNRSSYHSHFKPIQFSS